MKPSDKYRLKKDLAVSDYRKGDIVTISEVVDTITYQYERDGRKFARTLDHFESSFEKVKQDFTSLQDVDKIYIDVSMFDRPMRFKVVQAIQKKYESLGGRKNDFLGDYEWMVRSDQDLQCVGLFQRPWTSRGSGHASSSYWEKKEHRLVKVEDFLGDDMPVFDLPTNVKDNGDGTYTALAVADVEPDWKKKYEDEVQKTTELEERLTRLQEIARKYDSLRTSIEYCRYNEDVKEYINTRLDDVVKYISDKLDRIEKAT